MSRASFFPAVVILFGGAMCPAQEAMDFPEKLVIAQQTFIDVGTPNDFYELIQLSSSVQGVSIERVLITPEGESCVQPARVESRNAALHKSMAELLEGKNPCTIPDKELRRELRRCKKCPTFSGMNVTMEASCGDKNRRIRMDILDRDLFDARSDTPENTSWMMRLLQQVDAVSGPGAMDRPIFPTGAEASASAAPDTATIRALRAGVFDSLFGREVDIPEIMREADEPPPAPPTVELVSATISPVKATLPEYPPLARAARFEGTIDVTFDVDFAGAATHLGFVDDQRRMQLFRGVVGDAVSQWRFPESAFGQSGLASFQFKLNCQPHVHVTNLD